MKPETAMYIAVTIIVLLSFMLGIITQKPMIGLTLFFSCNIAFVIFVYIMGK